MSKGGLEGIIGGTAGGGATATTLSYGYGGIGPAAYALGLGFPAAIIGGTIAGVYLFSRLYNKSK